MWQACYFNQQTCRCAIGQSHVECVDEDVDPVSDMRFSRCRPLAAIERSGCFSAGKAAAQAAEAQAGIASTREPGDASPAAESSPCADRGAAQRVFYGNDTYYVFFRLHQYLYDRLVAIAAYVTMA